MITIEIIGMNHYMLQDYSHMHTKQIANLFEVSEEEIFFHTGDLKLIYDGVDQTSWHALCRVHLSSRFSPFEKNVAKYLLDTICDFVLNAHVQFVYFNESQMYEKLNNDYPKFIPHDEANDEYENDYEYEEDFSDEELFEGNAFEGFEEKLKEKNEADVKMCECGHLHECCNHTSIGCGKICGCGERCNDGHESCHCDDHQHCNHKH